ncbi:MAG: PD-(D/E)XK nuclease family protein [Candidatus Omnitrophica bacterium]|nr:PD-(D/E)XK nuclease family protein [Candidatus Omnitrophota bacterium]
MEKIITYNFSEDFIDKVAQYLVDFCQDREGGFGRTAVVFGGKRPALFLKRSLALKLNRELIAPQCFSIDEFVRMVATEREPVSPLRNLEAAYMVYSLARQNVPGILRQRNKFPDFLPWAREIVSFIDQLDLENIPDERLVAVEENAQIGYPVPQTINTLLKNIVSLRQCYHALMSKEKKYSRGFLYRTVAQQCAAVRLEAFDRILFCNFFDLHATEKQIVKQYFDCGKAVLFFQKDEHPWPQFLELSEYFNRAIEPPENAHSRPQIRLYAGFDIHSQVGLVREVLGGIEDKDKTVIVVPQADRVIPLLSEIAPVVDDFNVSMGYPVRRSTLYSLFAAIQRAQKTRKNNEYYSRDYLAVIMHPLLKNLVLQDDAAVTRVLVHKIEECLCGMEESRIGGSVFISLDAAADLGAAYLAVQDQLAAMGFSVTAESLRGVLDRLHAAAFRSWEPEGNLSGFAQTVTAFLDLLVERSALDEYPVNIKIVKKIEDICAELRGSELSADDFTAAELFKIFDDALRNEKISFSGMPLKGLQVLGLFETRALRFKHVIVMDVNETVLPRLSANEPLIPRAVMVSLGLDRLEEEEGIQRYQFLRLIGSAENVHLIYNDDPEMQKSRFIEEIVWEQEKLAGRMNVVTVPRAVFRTEILPHRGSQPKDANLSELLGSFVFSASSVNTYLNCPMQFYFRYVLGLSEKEDLRDAPESKEIGTFIHELLEDRFRCFIGKPPRIDAPFRKRFFDEFAKRFATEFSRRMKSDAFMLEQIMRYRLNRFLDFEAQRRVESIVSLEQDLARNIRCGGRITPFKCRIDRIDRLPGEILVIDYKTGSSDAVPAGLTGLKKAAEQGDRKSIKQAVHSFQLPLYLYCVQELYPGEPIGAALYNLRSLSLDAFPRERDKGFAGEIVPACLDLLGIIIDEIHNPDIPFTADDAMGKNCEYCPFVALCR